jgi:hypothetical protein
MRLPVPEVRQAHNIRSSGDQHAANPPLASITRLVELEATDPVGVAQSSPLLKSHALTLLFSEKPIPGIATMLLPPAGKVGPTIQVLPFLE